MSFGEGWKAEDFTDVRDLGRVNEEQLENQPEIYRLKSRANGVFIDKRIPYRESEEANKTYMERWVKTFKSLSEFAPFKYMKQVYPDTDSPADCGDYYMHLVTEYYPNRSLFDYLEAGNVLDETQKMVIIYGVAIQLMMMEMGRLVHRVLRPQSIMLDDQLYPHIMGLTNVREVGTGDSNEWADDEKASQTDLIGKSWTDCFISPEVANRESVNNGADSWSWAMITCYLLGGNIDRTLQPEEIRESAQSIAGDLDVPSAIRGLLQDCLVPLSERPQPSDICKQIWNGGDDMCLIEGVEMGKIREYFDSQCVFQNRLFEYWKE